LQRQAGDIQSYLAELRTELTLGPARAEDVPRVQQLFSKTNQFNVTTKRYSVADVERFISHERFTLVTARVKDAFGDMGMIGLYLVELEQRSARIDSFILSCRALGREVETAVMNDLKRRFLDSGKADRILAMFIPTKKNAPAASFFEPQGFEATSSREDATDYVLSKGRAKLIDSNHIKVLAHD
jgi:FkbH-like protein